MSSLLERRLQRIEAMVLPLPEKRMAVLFEPGRDATAEALDGFRAALAAATVENDRVWIVGVDRAGRERLSEKVEIVASELDAVLCILAGQPSTLGLRSRLDDVLCGLKGWVIGPSEGANLFIG